MTEHEGPEPLLEGRGLIFVEDFCRHSGLDEATVMELARSGRMEGLYRPDGPLVGFHDDTLPSREQLRAWGLPVSADYDPATVGHLARPPDRSPASGSTGWTMSWGDPGDASED